MEERIDVSCTTAGGASTKPSRGPPDSPGTSPLHLPLGLIVATHCTPITAFSDLLINNCALMETTNSLSKNYIPKIYLSEL